MKIEILDEEFFDKNGPQRSSASFSIAMFSKFLVSQAKNFLLQQQILWASVAWSVTWTIGIETGNMHRVQPVQCSTRSTRVRLIGSCLCAIC